MKTKGTEAFQVNAARVIQGKIFHFSQLEIGSQKT